MKCKRKIKYMTLTFLEIALLIFFASLFTYNTIAGVGENVTVITQLNIGNVFPEILNVSLNNEEDIALTPNETTLVSCMAVVRDYNGRDDIANVEALLYDSSAIVPKADAGNDHYTNSSCEIIYDFGTYNTYVDDGNYTALANCSFHLQYYANPGEWICNVTVNDTYNWQDNQANTGEVLQLLALGLPETIHYGTVNATFVSDENVTTVTNFGNVMVNLSLEGYGAERGDGFAMNCTTGNVQNISIEYERFNLTETTPGPLTLSEFNSLYEALTSDPLEPLIRQFQLDYKQDDDPTLSQKDSFWRIYVPIGVAGTCDGHIIFGATTAPEP